MVSVEDTDTFPAELQEKLTDFDEVITKIEETFKSLHSVPLNEIYGEVTALEKAKLDILGAYAMNSLFWVYLVSKGENPRTHGIKTELERVKSYMNRVKEVEEKSKASKLDKAAAKRFIKSALWQNLQSKPSNVNDKDDNKMSGVGQQSAQLNKSDSSQVEPSSSSVSLSSTSGLVRTVFNEQCTKRKHTSSTEKHYGKKKKR